jgi:hypothetical protein
MVWVVAERGEWRGGATQGFLMELVVELLLGGREERFFLIDRGALPHTPAQQ